MTVVPEGIVACAIVPRRSMWIFPEITWATRDVWIGGMLRGVASGFASGIASGFASGFASSYVAKQI